MESRAHICEHQNTAESQAHPPRLLLPRLGFELRRAWQILRAVLRGYLAGQPADDSRPRKGCC